MTNARKSFTRKYRNEKKKKIALKAFLSVVTGQYFIDNQKKTTKHLVQQGQRTWTNETLLAPLNDSRN